jgi:threonine aldolase
MSQIDPRSDGVTLPSAAMRAAMSDAPIGDDQYSEDASINSLQKRVAKMVGKEAALFVPQKITTQRAKLSAEREDALRIVRFHAYV